MSRDMSGWDNSELSDATSLITLGPQLLSTSSTLFCDLHSFTYGTAPFFDLISATTPFVIVQPRLQHLILSSIIPSCRSLCILRIETTSSCPRRITTTSTLPSSTACQDYFTFTSASIAPIAIVRRSAGQRIPWRPREHILLERCLPRCSRTG